MRRFGPPEIFNTDQGAQFTSEAFTGVLKAHGIEISYNSCRNRSCPNCREVPASVRDLLTTS